MVSFHTATTTIYLIFQIATRSFSFVKTLKNKTLRIKVIRGSQSSGSKFCEEKKNSTSQQDG